MKISKRILQREFNKTSKLFDQEFEIISEILTTLNNARSYLDTPCFINPTVGSFTKSNKSSIRFIASGTSWSASGLSYYTSWSSESYTLECLENYFNRTLEALYDLLLSIPIEKYESNCRVSNNIKRSNPKIRNCKASYNSNRRFAEENKLYYNKNKFKR